MTLEIQALTMLHMVGAGVYIGMALDTFNRLRIKKKKLWLMIIQDLLFWIFNVIIVFLWLQAVNQGEMRIYIFLSLLCGFAMYKALLEQIYRKTLNILIRFIIGLYHWMIRIVHYTLIKPVIWIYQAIVAIVLFIIGLILQLGQYLYRFCLFCIRPIIHIFKKGWAKYKRRRTKAKEAKQAKQAQQALLAKKLQEEKKPKQKEGFFSWVAKRLFKK